MKIEITINTFADMTPIELPFTKAYEITSILLDAGFSVRVLNEDSAEYQRNKAFRYIPLESDTEEELDTLGDFFVYTNADPYDVRELVRLLYEYKLFEHIDSDNLSIIREYSKQVSPSSLR